MQTHIRPFTSASAAGLLAVEAAVWAESSLDPRAIAALATQPHHGVWIAEGDGQVAGFAWCFLTETHARGPSWEIDVLAVHPAYRGQGLGVALVRAAHTGGEERGAPVCRAIVATTNRASQRTFEKAGFASDGQEHDLLARMLPDQKTPAQVTAPLSTTGSRHFNATAQVEALPVHTLLYSGLWLEAIAAPTGAALEPTLRQVEDFAHARGLTGVTHLCRAHDWRTRDALVAQGFRIENHYHVYTRSYPA